MFELAGWFLTGLMLLTTIALALWVAGAIWFDLGQEKVWGKCLALVWCVGVVWLFTAWQPLWEPFAVFLGIVLAFIGTWLLQKPRHDRDWDPSVAVLPRCACQDDLVVVENVRDFAYRSLSDFTPRYNTRTLHLANLDAADIIFFNWGSRWMSHPVLVFDFGSDGRICISIEVRYRKGQKYSIVRSLYRQQELIFLVAEERDVVLRRIKYSTNQTGRLYRLQASREELQAVFLDYCNTINDLYASPRWYHGFCANCTTSFYRLPSRRFRLDWRILLNGMLEWSLYVHGRLDQSLPFDTAPAFMHRRYCPEGPRRWVRGILAPRARRTSP